MQTNTPIEFNPIETKLMYDQELFPLKRMIIEKLSSLFQTTIEHLKDTAIHKQFIFPNGTDCQIGKISKGENHLQFPYVVLDFPKKFDQNNIFCFRNMFWFGHYFSSSLILSGDFILHYKSQFMLNRKSLHEKDTYFSMQKDPWRNETELPFSVLIEVLSDEQIVNQITENKFVKLTHRFVSTDSKNVVEIICKNYECMMLSISGGSDSF